MLENVIISRMILFSMVLIMPKGHFSQIKVAVCNVPVEADSMSNILQYFTDSNGLILTKLKRKLSYRGHVLFVPVRPDVVQLILDYLKQNNFLDNKIVINTDNIPVDLLCLDEIPAVREVYIQEETELADD